MKILFISFFVIGLAVLGMAVGVLLGGRRRCLRGSCGGLNQATGGEDHCFCAGRSGKDHL